MSETPSKKVAISQFLIKNVTDVNTEPVTPVKIAPPPVTVKRAKSLKSERTKFKRYVSVPNPRRQCLTLPRQHTAPVISHAVDSHETDSIATENGSESKTVVLDDKTVDVPEDKREDPDSPKQRTVSEVPPCFSNGTAMPEPASWQAIVNTHRRGSSMTFVSSQNWAQFDAVPVKEQGAQFDWDITLEQWGKYEEYFHSIKPLHGFISGKQSREYLMNTGLSRESLAEIWDLADMDHDGSLSLAEFAVAMHCVSAVACAVKLPATVPRPLRDSLLFHINNRNSILSSLNKGEVNKSPEKSSLKSSGSTSKGANVTFREEGCTCDTLPRSRPRPTRKLITTTPLHLVPHSVQSSSYSSYSDNSEEESEPVSRKLDLTEMTDKEKCDKSKTHKSSESETRTDNSHTQDEGVNKVVRRDRTYEDVGDFVHKLEIEEGAEDVEALLSSTDDEVSTPPPSGRPPARTASRRPDVGPPSRASSGPPPSGPPPSSPPSISPPSVPPPIEEEASPEEIITTTSAEEGNSSSEKKDPEGYERLAEDRAEAPTILLNEGEMIDSEDSEERDDVTPRQETPRDTATRDTATRDTATRDIATRDTATRDTPAQEELDNYTDLPIMRMEQPAMSRNHRSGSVDSALLSYCFDKNTYRIQDFPPVCQNKLNLEDLEAEDDELKVEYETRMWQLDDVLVTEPDVEQLKLAELNELRTMIRDYELHNNALFNVARELKIELLKVQEQKYHLLSTLKCMAKV